MSYKDFERDWKIDWHNKTIQKAVESEIKNYDVSDFWRWVRKEEASSVGMAYPHILDTDGMGPSYKIPRKIKLVNGYTIDQDSIKYLYGSDSTLLDANNNVLVSDSLHTKEWWENTFFQVIMAILAIIGIILAII